MNRDLRILHIIPAAFEYFDDIKSFAFGLVGEMNSYPGIFADVFTLQYGNPSKLDKEEVLDLSPNQEYSGTETIEEAQSEMLSYDIIHLHAPFLGAASKIIAWKKENPEIPLFLTYYRNVGATDLIALGIKWYNSYYLPKVFEQADFINTFPWSDKAAQVFLKGKSEKTECFDFIKRTDIYSVLKTEKELQKTTQRIVELYNNFI